MPTEIELDLDGLTLADLVAVARQRVRVRLSPNAVNRIQTARRLVERWVAEGKIVYGITTGFGSFSDVPISQADTRKLQENLLKSHSAGVGAPLEEEIVRAMMLLRLKDLARGNTGIRPETVNLLLELLNRNICPVVPRKGSVGASGDLAPLAHLSLVLIGLGEALTNGALMSGGQALAMNGLKPICLEAGEGLALINGTQGMTAIGGLAVYDALNLTKTIDIAAVMSLETLMGSRTEFNPMIHQARPHPGQIRSAENMNRISVASEIITSHKDCKRVQDAYTLRCSPQVHGAARDAVDYAAKTMVTEMNSSTNNPLIFTDTEQVLSGGNFHGEPVALALDFLCMAVSELASISERRIERLLNPKLSGLPAFLVKDGGLQSGFMIAQYTAAALVSENKVLSHPACVDSIPTSANKEDHVSMGAISALKCREIVENTTTVIAIELLCAAQGLDLFTNLKPGAGTLAAYHALRNVIPHLEEDRVLATDIALARDLIKRGTILDAVEQAVGQLI